MNIGVIIPYFQRETGLLAKALASVIAQKVENDWRLHVMVIDDSSPAPSDGEIAGIVWPWHATIEVIRQPNAGPGAARNAALDALDAHDIDFIAFLDSDDEWQPAHLCEAIEALGDDCDLFFANHEHFSNEANWLFGKIEEFQRKFPAAFAGDPAQPDLLKIGSHEASIAFAEDCYCQTSTVVLRSAVLGKVRFDTSLKGAGEDVLFWFDCARAMRCAVMSKRVSVRCGRGVNIYYNNLVWDADSGADRYGYFVLYFLKLAERMPLTPALAQRFAAAQRLYAYLALRTLIKRRTLNLPLALAIASHSPAVALRLPVRLGEYFYLGRPKAA